MTSKKHKQAIADSLSSALEPPKSRRPSPALDGILSQYAPAPEPPAPPSTPPSATMSTQSTQSTHSRHVTGAPTAAPTRDFQKVANSITRVAVPAGVFKGKCKQLYDFLYSKTRGAVVPSKEVRLTRREIMRGSDIGSTKTLFLNLRHLRDAGFVTWDERAGPHDGNVYTVHLPEEIEIQNNSGYPEYSEYSEYSEQKVPRVLRVESTQSTHSSSVDNTGGYGEPKTYIKTNTEKTDDEAFATLVAKLRAATREVSGKEPSKADAERWAEVAELLVTELKVAASRTSVTSAPAFLAEHLRRRLRKTDARQIEREVGEASSRQPASAPKPELTPEQIEGQVNRMVGLMREGAEIRELEERYAAEFRPAQWHMIRSIALAQASAAATDNTKSET